MVSGLCKLRNVDVPGVVLCGDVFCAFCRDVFSVTVPWHLETYRIFRAAVQLRQKEASGRAREIFPMSCISEAARRSKVMHLLLRRRQSFRGAHRRC